MKRIYKINILIFLFFASSITYVFSNGSGKTGQTNTGCGTGSCHGSSNSNTTVTVSSASGFEVDPNSTVNLTVTVENSSGQSKAGANISVQTTSGGGSNIGTLTAGNDLKTQSNELTHKTNGGKALTNNKATFDFEWKAPSTAGEYYIKAAGNATNANGNTGGDQWALMIPKKITVRGITLTSLLGGQELCAGTSTNITWNQFAIADVKIELSTNGGSSFDETIVPSTPGASGTYVWNIPSNFNADNYRIRISDALNSSINASSTSNFSVSGETAITTHPQSTQVCSGENVNLSVIASGSNLTYQWYKNDNKMTGKTADNLAFTNVISDDAAAYYCEVSSSCGNPINSNIANLTVLESPKITSISNNKSLCIGENYSIEVIATGNNLTYQWYKDDNIIQNETTSILQINNAKESDDANYKVQITSPSCGNITSNLVKITVLKEAQIVNHPLDTIVCESGTLLLSTTATGSALQYQWKLNNQDIPNANNPNLIIEGFSNSHVGKYKCSVKNLCGEIFTNEANVSIKFLPTITNKSKDVSVKEGVAITLSVDATGEDLIYEWYLNTKKISNQSGKDIIINNIRKADAGDYVCRVYNDCGFVDSEPIKVTVTNPGTGGILTLSETKIDFGQVLIGQKKDLLFKKFFKNIGDDIITVSSVKIKSSNSVFSLKEIFSFGLDPEEERELLATFRPTNVSEYKDTLVITIKDQTEQLLIPMSGIGVEVDNSADVVASASSLNFGDIVVGTFSEKELELDNKSTNNSATLTSIDFSIPEFKLKESLTFPLVLDKSSKMKFELMFAPTNEGVFEGKTTFNFSNSDKIDVSLKGTATIASVTNYFESINVFPNPSNENITLNINSKNQQEFTVMIIDINGNLVYSLGNQTFTKGNNKLNWNGYDANGNKVANGAYNLLIMNDKVNIVEKIIVK